MLFLFPPCPLNYKLKVGLYHEGSKTDKCFMINMFSFLVIEGKTKIIELNKSI